MKIGLYSPYLPHHFGGGEKHFLTTAAYLSQRHTVEILIQQLPPDLKEQVRKYESRFDLDLAQIEWRESKLAGAQQSALATWRETSQYDAFFYLTDGSLFFNGSPRGIVHVQIPFTQELSLIGKLKLKTWKILNTNSEFTKKVIERSWGRSVDVVHAPFVDHSLIPQSLPRKNKDILSVGRIFAEGAGHNKKQDFLIEAFIDGCKKFGWNKTSTLHIAGAIEPGEANQNFAAQLQQLAAGWPITFHFDVSAKRIQSLYEQSRIYWHAAGYNVDETQHPEKVEHFGMAPLEAQAWGCIPIVVPKGGIRETITPNETGLIFQTTDELVSQTEKVLRLSEQELQAWQVRVQTASERYSLSRFCQTIDQMIEQPTQI